MPANPIYIRLNEKRILVFPGGTGAFLRADGTFAAVGGGGLSDGDKGDITVSGGSSVWTIDNDVVTYAKMQNISAASRLLGRGDSGAGDPQEIILGSGLTMTGTTLSSTGGTGLTHPQVLARGLGA